MLKREITPKVEKNHISSFLSRDQLHSLQKYLPQFSYASLKAKLWECVCTILITWRQQLTTLSHYSFRIIVTWPWSLKKRFGSGVCMSNMYEVSISYGSKDLTKVKEIIYVVCLNYWSLTYIVVQLHNYTLSKLSHVSIWCKRDFTRKCKHCSSSWLYSVDVIHCMYVVSNILFWYCELTFS